MRALEDQKEFANAIRRMQRMATRKMSAKKTGDLTMRDHRELIDKVNERSKRKLKVELNCSKPFPNDENSLLGSSFLKNHTTACANSFTMRLENTGPKNPRQQRIFPETSTQSFFHYEYGRLYSSLMPESQAEITATHANFGMCFSERDATVDPIIPDPLLLDPIRLPGDLPLVTARALETSPCTSSSSPPASATWKNASTVPARAAQPPPRHESPPPPPPPPPAGPPAFLQGAAWAASLCAAAGPAAASELAAALQLLARAAAMVQGA